MSDAVILKLIADGRLKVDCESGLAYALKSNTPEKPIGALTKKGYIRACLTVDGKQCHFMLHRIVWVSAHGPLMDGCQIDHINAVKTDNRIANLEAVSGLVNMRRAAHNGLTNGGWRNAPRNSTNGQYLSKRAGRLLDGVEHNGEVPK